jgi:signal transduction histidine kinase
VLSHVLQQVYAPKPLTIQYQFSANLPCFGDREDMLELLGNLLDNACKWARQQVQCTLTAEQNQIYISISDDGSVPSADALQTLTARGTRLDESIEGYGLGLAICKDIIKLYNGSLHFSVSQTLGGLEVKVCLPLA